MKNNFYLYLLISVLLSSCKSGGLGDCFKPIGSTVMEDRFVGRLNAIELHDRINLHVSFSEDLSLKVRAGKNIIESIKTEMRGITLVIKDDNRCNWVRTFKKEIDVFLTTPEIEKFSYYGSGDVHFNDTLKTDTFRLEMWDGTASLNLNIDADYVSLKCNNGPGDVYCYGKTSKYVGFNNGTGTLDTRAMKAKRVLAVNPNRGKLIVHASEQLEAEISSSGDIEYFGSPSIELKNTGSGKLIAR